MNTRSINLRFYWRLLIVGVLAASVFAQQPQRVDQKSPEYSSAKLASTLMGREMPYRVIFPRNYAADKNRRYPVIYLLHGLWGHFDNWTEKTKVAKYAADHEFIIVTPEGDDGWYTDSAIKPSDKYESYIVKELISEIDTKYRTIADRDHRVIAGLSMGGYGAAKFGMKYSEMFTLVGSFSGAMGGAGLSEKKSGNLGKTVDAVMGPDDSDVRKINDAYAILRAMSADRVKSLPFIYQSCGTEDFLIEDNRNFVALMVEKKVPHEYREMPGAHTWTFWDDQVREFLDVAARRIASK